MDVGVLFSGGKDSALAALLLDPICEVELLCGTFGITDDVEHAVAAGRAMNLPVTTIDLDPAVARGAVEQMVADGYPRNGIQQVHEHALTVATKRDLDAVADGTRRDDRVPTVDRSLAQHVEDRYGVSHMAPLAGFGRTAIDELATRLLDLETGPSEEVPTGDYETELRALLRSEHGADAVAEVFPPHEQSSVVARRERR